MAVMLVMFTTFHPKWRPHAELNELISDNLMNNSSAENPTDQKLRKIDYLLILYDISLSWRWPFDRFDFRVRLRDMTVKTTRYDVEIIPTPRLGVSLKISENTFGLSGAEPLVGWGKGEGRGEGGALGFSLDTIFLSVNKKQISYFRFEKIRKSEESPTSGLIPFVLKLKRTRKLFPCSLAQNFYDLA